MMNFSELDAKIIIQMFAKRVKTGSKLNPSLFEDAAIQPTEDKPKDSNPQENNEKIENMDSIAPDIDVTEEAIEKSQTIVLLPTDKLYGQKSTHIGKKRDYDVFNDPLELLKKKSHFKTACNVDFNPSRCKDFHDNGYCGWGASCLYAHDRTDYKAGWELDNQWEKEERDKIARSQRIRQKKALDPDFNSSDEDLTESELKIRKSFEKCFICKADFTTPLLASCSHIFCEKCILAEFAKTKKCPVCGLKLTGIFNDGAAMIKLKQSSLKSAKKEIRIRKDLNDAPHYLRKLADTKVLKQSGAHINANEYEPVIVNPDELHR